MSALATGDERLQGNYAFFFDVPGYVILPYTCQLSSAVYRLTSTRPHDH
jgi:hypothetical protein